MTAWPGAERNRLSQEELLQLLSQAKLPYAREPELCHPADWQGLLNATDGPDAAIHRRHQPSGLRVGVIHLIDDSRMAIEARAKLGYRLSVRCNPPARCSRRTGARRMSGSSASARCGMPGWTAQRWLRCRECARWRESARRRPCRLAGSSSEWAAEHRCHTRLAAVRGRARPSDGQRQGHPGADVAAGPRRGGAPPRARSPARYDPARPAHCLDQHAAQT